MRKRLSTIMAIVAALSMLFIAGPVLAGNGSTGEDVVLSGSVPWAHDWTVTAADNSSALTEVTASEYDAPNGKEIADLMVISALDSNSYFTISAKRGAWTTPTGCTENQGKHGTGGRIDTDFRIKVTDVATGSGGATEAFGVKGAFAGYTGITTSDQIIAGGDDEVRGYTGAGCDIDASILFAYDYDIKGAYGLTLTLTLANATE